MNRTRVGSVDRQLTAGVAWMLALVSSGAAWTQDFPAVLVGHASFPRKR
jgi:hypothetical protein